MEYEWKVLPYFFVSNIQQNKIMGKWALNVSLFLQGRRTGLWSSDSKKDNQCILHTLECIILNILNVSYNYVMFMLNVKLYILELFLKMYLLRAIGVEVKENVSYIIN